MMLETSLLRAQLQQCAYEMHKQKVFEFVQYRKVRTKERKPKKTSYLFDSRRALLLTIKKNVRLLNLQKIIFKEVLLLSSRTICFRDCIVRSICKKIELRQDWFISKTAPSPWVFITEIERRSICTLSAPGVRLDMAPLCERGIKKPSGVIVSIFPVFAFK